VRRGLLVWWLWYDSTRLIFSEKEMSVEADEIWAILRENSLKMGELQEAQRKTDEQMRKTDEKLERIGKRLGDMGDNQGAVTEEFFYNSLKADLHLGAIHFEDICKNEQKYRAKTEEEYDIIMTNGEAVGIIEVKYKAHENDLKQLERKMKNFKKLYPVYKDHKLYGAIASFHIYDDAKHAALQRGYFVLQRSGNVIHTDCGENLLVL
jgi:hypothetical protein